MALIRRRTRATKIKLWVEEASQGRAFSLSHSRTGVTSAMGGARLASWPLSASPLQGESRILVKTDRYASSQAALGVGMRVRRAPERAFAIGSLAKGLVEAIPVLVVGVRVMHIGQFWPRFEKGLLPKAAAARRTRPRFRARARMVGLEAQPCVFAVGAGVLLKAAVSLRGDLTGARHGGRLIFSLHCADTIF